MLKFCRLCDSHEPQLIVLLSQLPHALWPVASLSDAKSASDLYCYECQSCGLVQLQDFERKEIEHLYSFDYYNVANHEEEIRRNHLVTQIMTKSTRVLDVGGGTNSDTNLNRSQIDVVDLAVNKSSLPNYYQGFIEDVNLGQNVYDVILAFHVLEHLQNPKAVLEKFHRSLKPLGTLLIEVPNLAYYLSNLPYYLFFYHHISVFSITTLEAILEKTGFFIDEVIAQGNVLLVRAKERPYFEVVQRNDDGILGTRTGNSQTRQLALRMTNLETRLLLALNNKGFVILGAGGSTTLLLYHCRRLVDFVDAVYDSDERKVNKIIPGTSIKVSAMPKDFVGKNILVHSEAILQELEIHECKVLLVTDYV